MTSSSTSAPSPPTRPPRLLDRLADALRSRGYVPPLRDAYVDWAHRYIFFHQLRHPQDLGPAEAVAFLTSLAGNLDLPPAAEVEPRATLLFLYDVVLGQAHRSVHSQESGPAASLCAFLAAICPDCYHANIRWTKDRNHEHVAIRHAAGR